MPKVSALLTKTHGVQVSDFLMRVNSGRFPSIEEDMRMVLAHCGSLLLDPAALCQVDQPLCQALYPECYDSQLVICSFNFMPDQEHVTQALAWKFL